MNDVICCRCKSAVLASHTDFCDDGIVCRTCLVAAASDQDFLKMERELARSTARRRILTGGIMLTFGLVILSLGMSGGGLVLVPTGMLVGGAVELGRGLMVA